MSNYWDAWNTRMIRTRKEINRASKMMRDAGYRTFQPSNDNSYPFVLVFNKDLTMKCSFGWNDVPYRWYINGSDKVVGDRSQFPDDGTTKNTGYTGLTVENIVKHLHENKLGTPHYLKEVID